MTRPRTTIRWRTEEEQQAVSGAAAEAGAPLATWLRSVALQAAGRPDLLPESEATIAARRLREGRRHG